MLRDRDADLGSHFVGNAHDASVIDEIAVISDGDGTGGDEFGDGGDLATGATHGDGASGKDSDEALVAGVVDGSDQPIWGIERRLRVGHLDDGGEAASGRSGGATGDGFLVLLAGGSEVGVEVNETGGDEKARSLDVPDMSVGGSEAGSNFGDTPVDDEHVGDFVAAGGGVEDATADDEEGGWVVGGFRHAAFVCTRRLISAPRAQPPGLVHWRG